MDATPAQQRFSDLWDTMGEVVRHGPPLPEGLIASGAQYHAFAASIRQEDAYNSLSIEGYAVTREMIGRLDRQRPDPDTLEDHQERWATGYLQAFDLAANDTSHLADGTDTPEVIDRQAGKWHRHLFREKYPLGYRRHPVFLRGSRHTPPSDGSVPDLMRTYFDKLRAETSPHVIAVMGHFGFGYIHPYSDGNGRVSRFIMNAGLAMARQPWTTVHLSNREEYLGTLEAASQDGDIKPFVQFVSRELAAARSQVPASLTRELSDIPRVNRVTPPPGPSLGGGRSL